jgi:hypothetical protein
MTRRKSTMTKTEVRRFEELLAQNSAGEGADTLKELHSLAEALSSPIDKAGILYHEVMWLLDLGDVSGARVRFGDMKTAWSRAVLWICLQTMAIWTSVLA